MDMRKDELDRTPRSDAADTDASAVDRAVSSRRAAPDGDAPVTNLIEGYRSRRLAWIAEAEALAQMRDEVHDSADRERMEIITRARERARAVIAAARRDLLTLRAQVQASLGPDEPPSQVSELFGSATRRRELSTDHADTRD